MVVTKKKKKNGNQFQDRKKKITQIFVPMNVLHTFSSRASTHFQSIRYNMCCTISSPLNARTSSILLKKELTKPLKKEANLTM